MTSGSTDGHPGLPPAVQQFNDYIMSLGPILKAAMRCPWCAKPISILSADGIPRLMVCPHCGQAVSPQHEHCRQLVNAVPV